MLVNELPQRSRGREPGIPDETQSFDYAGWGGGLGGGVVGGLLLGFNQVFHETCIVCALRMEICAFPCLECPSTSSLPADEGFHPGGGGTKEFRHLGNKSEIRLEVGNVVDAASNFDSIFSLFPLFRKYFQSSQIKFIS